MKNIGTLSGSMPVKNQREKNYFKEINRDEKGSSILFLGKTNLFCTSDFSQNIKNNAFSNQVLCVCWIFWFMVIGPEKVKHIISGQIT